MAIHRRDFLFSIAAFLASVLLTGLAQAAPYRDNTDLPADGYIWQPTYAATGAVVMIATLSTNQLHVYRGGKLLGIGRFHVTNNQTKKLTPGVVLLSAARTSVRSLEWNGSYLNALSMKKSETKTATPSPTLNFDPEFADLLRSATTSGATLIVANHRSTLQKFSTHHNPMKTSASSDHTNAFTFVNNAYPFKKTETSQQPSLISVSSRDQSSWFFVHSGHVLKTKAIVDQPKKPLGHHVYFMVSGAQLDQTATWLAIGIGTSDTDRAVAKSVAKQTFHRIALSRAPSASVVNAANVHDVVVITSDASRTPQPQQTPQIVFTAERLDATRVAGYCQSEIDGCKPKTTQKRIKRRKWPKKTSKTIKPRPQDDPLAADRLIGAF